MSPSLCLPGSNVSFAIGVKPLDPRVQGQRRHQARAAIIVGRVCKHVQSTSAVMSGVMLAMQWTSC